MFRREEGATPPVPFMPYLKDISLPTSVCPTCDDAPCVGACSSGLIVLDKGIPALDFTKGGCTFCEMCALVCRRGVLDADMSEQTGAEVFIKTKECLAWRGTMCYTCKDICPKHAITFMGIFRPSIDMELCNGCGECIAPCPSEAIHVRAKKELS
jgi:ferredoxin-type protein NapF